MYPSSHVLIVVSALLLFVQLGLYMGKHEEALVQYQKALEVFLAVYGQEAMSVADTYNNMAIVYKSQGHYERALEYYQKSLDIKMKVVGHDHIDVAASYTNIAGVYQKEGKRAQANEMATKAYDINLKVLGPDHPRTRQLKSFLGK